MAIDNLHCSMSYAVYKFQPEILSYSACCDATIYDMNLDSFDRLGNRYFEEDPRLVKRKQDLYSNIKNTDCFQCWQKEDLGLRSMRQELSPSYDMLHDNRNLNVNHAYPGRIELWMNSTCNLGCFMCHLGNSNTLRKIWKKDYDTRGMDGAGFEIYRDKIQNQRPGLVDEFKDRMMEFTLRYIREAPIYDLTIAYLGGEPTLHDEMYDHADLFIEAGREAIKAGKRLMIEITTNGTSKDKLNERFYRMFEKYKSAGWTTRIMLSQDGANESAQVRWGADFKQIRRNFGNWIREDSPVDFTTTFTVVSNLNLPYINEMADYLHEEIERNYEGKTKKLSLAFNTLIQPDWMQVRFLPRQIAIENAEYARDILQAIQTKYPSMYYQRGLFENIFGTLKDRPSNEDIKYFFNKLDYTNGIYKKYDAKWDFYEKFPHLNEIKTMYGLK